jgi:ferric-dicitrate binding protein FerR (iron transport regulator)
MRLHRRQSLLLMALTLLAASAGADQASQARGSMVVSLLEGEAKVASGAEPARPIAIGDALHEGDQVQTGVATHVEIRLMTGSIIRLGESTTAVLREAPPEGGRFRLKLLAGNFWAHVSKLLAGDRFEVETENAVAGVRGTEFRVEAGGGQGDLLRVYEGVVQVDHAAGKFTARVEPGRELRYHKDSGTTGPQAFDSKSEADHPFMRWVRERKLKDRGDSGSDKKDKDDRKERRGIKDRMRLNKGG